MDHFSITANPSSSSKPSNNGKEKKKKGCKRNNTSGVKLSTDPQSVAARERRHRISDRFKILQSLVPGGTKMDTVSMLEEAINYVKFLKTQILLHQTIMNFVDDDPSVNLPGSLNPPQQPLCFETNFVPEVQPSTSQLLPDSCFQCEEDICFDTFLDNN